MGSLADAPTRASTKGLGAHSTTDEDTAPSQGPPKLGAGLRPRTGAGPFLNRRASYLMDREAARSAAAPVALAIDNPKAARKLAPEPVTELRRDRHRVRVAVAHEPLPRIPLEVPEPVSQLALNRLDARQAHWIERARER